MHAILNNNNTNDNDDDTMTHKIASVVPSADERRKLIPLAIMFFCILFNYTVLRDTKDVLMVTAPKSGAEVIPFIKTYCNLPTAIVREKKGRITHRKSQPILTHCCVCVCVSLSSFAPFF